MTVTADGVVAGGSAARVSGRGPARAAAVEQLSRADRVARGKDARAAAPLESHAEFSPGRGAGSGRAAAGARRSRGCRSWCRSGTGGCWCRRSRSTGARRCRWRRTWPARPRRGCGCSCAGTPTCRISARSPRRSGTWSSTSTTSTRPCPGRSSGTSSGWPRAWPWPHGTTGSPPRPAARSLWRRPNVTAPRCAGSRTQTFMDVWYTHVDIEPVIAEFRSQVKAKRFKEAEKLLAKAHTSRHHEGAWAS